MLSGPHSRHGVGMREDGGRKGTGGGRGKSWKWEGRRSGEKGKTLISYSANLRVFLAGYTIDMVTHRVVANDWAFFDTMIAALTDREWVVGMSRQNLCFAGNCFKLF